MAYFQETFGEIRATCENKRQIRSSILGVGFYSGFWPEYTHLNRCENSITDFHNRSSV